MGCVNRHNRVTGGTDISPKELIILKQVPGVGPYRLRTLVQYFQGMDAIRRARPAQLMRAEGMDRTCAIGLARLFRSPLKGAAEKSADEQCDRVERAGGRIVTFWDEEYPANLKTIDDPPPSSSSGGNSPSLMRWQWPWSGHAPHRRTEGRSRSGSRPI